MPELVLNGDYEELGSELANFSDSNISFGNSSDSTTISLSANSYRSEAFGNTGDDRPRVTISGSGIVTGKTYEVTYTPTSFTGSTVFDFFENNTRIINNHDASIAKTFYFVASSSLDAFVFDGSDTFRSDYTLSIKQVDPNDRWILANGALISNGQLTLPADSANVSASLNIGDQTGNILELTYTVVSSNISGGNFRVGGLSGASVAASATNLTSSVGAHTVFIEVPTSGSNSVLDLHLTSSVTSGSLVLDNVTIKEYAIQPLDI